MLTCDSEITAGLSMSHYLSVDQPDSLIPALDGHDTVGVDTEFMREKTYFAQLCLVQLSTNERNLLRGPVDRE